jgi:transcriptional regulator with XRE-family HTH domain
MPNIQAYSRVFTFLFQHESQRIRSPAGTSLLIDTNKREGNLMNFGEKLKQLRTDKNLTQPQLAEAIGIEQSYLSKLENDKSIPSAETFQAILKALAVDVGSLLDNIDKKFIHSQLRQIPEVANYLHANIAGEIHNIKKWLFASAAACAFGLSLIVSGYMGFIFSNVHYSYYSEGVVKNNESADIFERYLMMYHLQRQAGIISEAEASKLSAEITSTRRRPEHLVQTTYRGESFKHDVAGGFRQYVLRNTASIRRMENNLLMFLGTLLAFAGLFGFVVEYRLRRSTPTR